LHQENDPENVNRIIINNHGLVAEILPSKGLSVGQAQNNKKGIFWEPPAGIPDPDLLDLNSDEIAINGKPHHGFTFLKTFTGGIELYGLKNWGMPENNKNGRLLPLHGETSNIPVEEVMVTFNKKERTVEVRGEFFYNSYEGDDDKPWYLRGERMFRIIRRVVVRQRDEPSIELYDIIENITDVPLFADWGYHITFLPEKGARIIIPSKHFENRSGGEVPEDIESWQPATDEKTRTEAGIIHKDLKVYTEHGTKINKALIERPDLGNLLVTFKPAPYTQSWICNGGANSSEFTITKTGAPLFNKNWDGIGIEIGASALDHNGNTDPAVPVPKPLKPKEKITNSISVRIINRNTCDDLAREFTKYSSGRITGS
jgi:hypothetical protein